jgi:hypothetical protein
MSYIILCYCYLLACTTNTFNCSSNLFNYFNNRVVCFNNLLAYTRCLFFCRPVFPIFLTNQYDNTSDCNSCSCNLLDYNCCRVLCSCNLFNCLYNLFHSGHLRKLSKPIYKTHTSTLQSKFCKKACIVLPRTGNFSNC